MLRGALTEFLSCLHAARPGLFLSSLPLVPGGRAAGSLEGQLGEESHWVRLPVCWNRAKASPTSLIPSPPNPIPNSSTLKSILTRPFTVLFLTVIVPAVPALSDALPWLYLYQRLLSHTPITQFRAGLLLESSLDLPDRVKCSCSVLLSSLWRLLWAKAHHSSYPCTWVSFPKKVLRTGILSYSSLCPKCLAKDLAHSRLSPSVD